MILFLMLFFIVIDYDSLRYNEQRNLISPFRLKINHHIKKKKKAAVMEDIFP